MQLACGNKVSVGGATRSWWCLVLLLLLTGAATAAPDSGQSAIKHGATYRVINLGAGIIATYPHINAAGQVAYSLYTGGRTTGFFHDGAAVRTLGAPGAIVYVNGLNDAGQVAGTSVNERDIEYAFVWSAGGGMLDLRAAPDGGRSYGWAINRHGVVTGAAGDAAHPFRWTAAAGVEDLGVTPAFPAPASGRVLNDGGVIAGVSTIDDEFTRVFVWTRAGGIAAIDTLGSVESHAVAVGAGGEVAGNRLPSFDAGGDRPFLWSRATGMVDLGIGRGTTAWVNAMTPALHIAGGIGYGDGRHRAMSWTRRSGMRELGTLGGRSSAARAVNTRGQIVGFAEDAAGAMRAFVWSAGSGMRDLNRLLRHAPPTLVLDHALSINDSGAIVASSNAGLVLLWPDQRRNIGHSVGPVVVAPTVVAGAPLQASVSFVDGDRVGTRSVEWSWGDGSGGAGRTVGERGGVGSASASHSYAAPGMYAVTATVVGGDGRRTVVSQAVEVTDPHSPSAGSAPSNI